MNELGRMYRDGKGGLAPDGAEAIRWFRKAADLMRPGRGTAFSVHSQWVASRRIG